MVKLAHSTPGRSAWLWNLLESVKDPEIPVLSIRELGVLREARIDHRRAHVVITPTYSGCPAMQTIRHDVEDCLKASGCFDIVIETRLAPVWTTDWISRQGQEKLRCYGIAPPQVGWPLRAVDCPRCRSGNTRLVSEFGSTPCKALFQCNACLEPFDYFKCL